VFDVFVEHFFVILFAPLLATFHVAPLCHCVKTPQIAKQTHVKNRNILSTNEKFKNRLASFSKTNPFTINITRSIANHLPNRSPSPGGEGGGEGELNCRSGREPALTVILAPKFWILVSVGPSSQIKVNQA
jgi:hypothetical protein